MSRTTTDIEIDLENLFSNYSADHAIGPMPINAELRQWIKTLNRAIELCQEGFAIDGDMDWKSLASDYEIDLEDAETALSLNNLTFPGL